MTSIKASLVSAYISPRTRVGKLTDILKRTRTRINAYSCTCTSLPLRQCVLRHPFNISPLFFLEQCIFFIIFPAYFHLSDRFTSTWIGRRPPPTPPSIPGERKTFHLLSLVEDVPACISQLHLPIVIDINFVFKLFC